ncbi:MAG: 16S rRNA (guanine(966)-N(2))-methyltransferase RsmD [Arenimonas sp. SCN 70-307]|uniref:16S rRNA (guanine(966)-N(2))-methyltransferase RsmD n=1 Tax=Arenimonas sp. SCN 70-307 TaxID=1660089 RepID=UPI00086E9EE9|nr:16S rRNA (guanine(966)-N(2))-methyltransferase RsmD [Arenimonas sp. SCN 70-307]ODS61713.1 MAG: 16S rRNA (guanine(966)-N(2))-methyltransferase RsmD [Arenimonas sp. SCN 70-307]
MNQRSKPRPPGSVRIIAGHLRGSKLPVPDRPGLRPTSDRVRETLFNWLQPVLRGARVLDLFAGTGALGFEAASRGAGEVVLVERDPGLAAGLREQATRLKAGLRVENADALAWLARPPAGRYDLVFLDPPFEAGLWQAAAVALGPWLALGALIYVETPRNASPNLPAGWQRHRQGQTRDVEFALYRTAAGPTAPGADTLGPESTPQGDRQE